MNKVNIIPKILPKNRGSLQAVHAHFILAVAPCADFSAGPAQGTAPAAVGA
jgi:hypothetical protein